MNAVAPILEPAADTPAAPTARRGRSIRRVAGVAVIAALSFTACASDPGPTQVAEDIIKAEAVLNPDLDEECLLRELERYDDDTLSAIAGDLSASDSARNERGEAALLAYQRSLEICL